MDSENQNELPDLSPATEGPTPIEPSLDLPKDSEPNSLPEDHEVFINPNASEVENSVNEAIIQAESQTKSKKKFLIWGLMAVLVLFLIGICGFVANELIFNRITTLSLIPDDTEYYLTLSIKEHPQAKKAKELVNKLPAGKKILDSLDDYSSELFGPQDPFEDIIRLAKEEIFLAKLYPTEGGERSYGTFDSLLNIVELPRPNDAREELEKFRKDSDIYDISDEPYEGQNIMNIKLKEKSSSASQRYGLGPLNTGVSLPLSKGVYATPVKNFIVASEKVADVKKSADLAKIKSFLGFKRSELKTLEEDPSHKQISRYFPKETLVKFYQNQPLMPFGNFLPNQSLSQSFMAGQDIRSDPKESSDTYIRIPQGMTVTASDEGLNMTSYQLDIETPEVGLKNPFKMESSLASRLPQKFSGISPAFYGETKNYNQIYQDQIEQMEDIAENSDNRNQRKQFKEVLKYLDEFRSGFRTTVGIDYEKDLLAYLESHVAVIFNAGSAKKSPEFLVVADIADQKKVEGSLTQIKIPNYLKEYELSMQDSTRRSDLYSIGNAIKLYMKDKSKVPSSLNQLVPDYLSKIPKDPVTKEPYTYTPSGDLKSAQIEVKLSDGRTAYWSTDTGYTRYKGIAKKVVIPPLTPKRSVYKNINVYTIDLYKYEKLALSLYFAITDKKLIILFGDSTQSLKEIIDFEDKPGTPLSSNENWKTQFDSKGEIGGFTYAEPIQFWGIVEYIQSLYPEYKTYITPDIELIFKGYLKTIKSIGTVTDKNGPVHTTNSFVSVIELPAEEKEKVEKVVTKLMDEDKKSGYNSVLGVETSTNTLELWKERLSRLFLPQTN